MPEYFLLIETSSDVCSVAVTSNGEIVALMEDSTRDHSAQLAPMIRDAMRRAGISYSELSCVGVNGGPGSYTGLRIGLSVAKGLCYATHVPLMMVDSLTAIANGLVAAQTVADDEAILATVENRRDEFFYAMFDAKLNRIKDVTLTTTSDESFKRLGGKCVITGSAASKISKSLSGSDLLTYVRFVDVAMSAVNLFEPVKKLFNDKQFADLAYSEPFYYKDVYIAPK